MYNETLIVLLLIVCSGCDSNIQCDSVCVAAIQCHSIMGDVEHNRETIERLIVQACSKGAKIIVTPECAVHGYMDPVFDLSWATDSSENTLPVDSVAESIPGPSTDYFSEIAKRHNAYICLGMIESSSGDYYNAQALIDPDGKIVGHHRKCNLWPPGDGLWATKGDLPLQIIDSPYGKLGMMICYDYHKIMPDLKNKGTDIVLYSVGWFGLNTESWFQIRFPRNHIISNNYSVVSANWASSPGNDDWSGHGFSCIYDQDGKIVICADDTPVDQIIVGHLKRKTQGN